MPTPLKSTDNMRKHMSKADRESRRAAEEGMKPDGRVVLKAPDWLSDDARKIFDATKRKLRRLGLLDKADEDILAQYSDAVVKYRKLSEVIDSSDDPLRSLAAQGWAQSWARIILAYAEKMGLSANGRARLAKKKAEAESLDPMDQLLNNVNIFVNGDVDPEEED